MSSAYGTCRWGRRTGKAAKYEIQKPSTWRATLFLFKFRFDVSRFSSRAINLARNKILCCKLNSFVAQSRLSFYFEIQVLALFLVFHRNYNLARNKSLILTNQRARSVQLATYNFVASQINTGYEKRETSNLNLTRNNVARQVEGFCISYFAAFSFDRFWCMHKG